PLDESPAHRVVFLLEQHGVPGHELARHCVRVREVTFDGIEDHVFERYIHSLFTELDWERLVGFVAQAVKKCGIDGCRFHSNQPSEGSSLCAVSLACGAEAAEQINLERGRFGELVRRQLGAALTTALRIRKARRSTPWGIATGFNWSERSNGSS